ncbi:MAG: pirin family protein [Bacteroidota bacterium]
MSLQIIPKAEQASGQFNGGQIIENKPIGFPQDGGKIRPYSNLFYWAYAEALADSTIGLHPHQGFEIMSFVLRGTIRHYDTKLKEWRELHRGDAQIIRAGNGISHAEHMQENAVMFQIWVDPNLDLTLQQSASYNDYAAAVFPVVENNGRQAKIYVGAGSPFALDTLGLEIEEWTLATHKEMIELQSDKTYSIYVLDGAAQFNGQSVVKDDFVVLSDTEKLELEASEGTRLFVIASPQEVPYKTYSERMMERVAR